MIPALFTMCLRSYLAVVGKAHVAMWLTFVLVLLNAGLNYAFIFGNLGAPALGVVGAAVASIGTKTAGAVWLLWYTKRQPELAKYDLYTRFSSPDWPALIEVARLGWPIGLTVIAEVGLFAATSVMAGWLGTIELAAHGIAIQLTSVAFMVPIGLSNASTVRVGVAHGRGDRTDLSRAGWSAVGIAACFGALSALIFWLVPGPLVSLFLDVADEKAPAVIAAAVPMIYVAAAFQIVDGIQAVSAGNLRGLKDTRVPMIIAVISYWALGMPAAYALAFPLGLGAVGVWIGLAVGLSLAAIFLTARFAMASRAA
jgi:multidrug resistance protein, MATE family